MIALKGEVGYAQRNLFIFGAAVQELSEFPSIHRSIKAAGIPTEASIHTSAGRLASFPI